MSYAPNEMVPDRLVQRCQPQYSTRPSCVVAVADLPRRQQGWLWPGWLPRGKLTLLGGEPEVGKSTLACDLAARLTAGQRWPDGAAASPAAEVLLLCAEDDACDTVGPRITAAGGRAAHAFVCAMQWSAATAPAARRLSVDADAYEAHRDLPLDPGATARALNFPADVGALERILDSLTAPRLVVLDPLAAYLGPAGDWGGEIQSRLAPLIDLAARWDVAILAITHRDLRPRPADGRRHRSAVALLAAARVAWQITRDPADPDRRVLQLVKNNLDPARPTLTFRPRGDHLLWPEDAALVPAPPPAPEPSEMDQAKAFLRQALAAGPVSSTQLISQAAAALLTYGTLRRAARAIGVRAGHAGFKGGWFWELPGPAKDDAHLGERCASWRNSPENEGGNSPRCASELRCVRLDIADLQVTAPLPADGAAPAAAPTDGPGIDRLTLSS